MKSYSLKTYQINDKAYGIKFKDKLALNYRNLLKSYPQLKGIKLTKEVLTEEEVIALLYELYFNLKNSNGKSFPDLIKELFQ